MVARALMPPLGTSRLQTAGPPVPLRFQRGIRIFLHLNTGPDNTNTVTSALGLLIVFLIIAGSLSIMANLDHNMPPMAQVTQMRR